MRRELFAAVSHDLRTPITALGLLATAIDDEVVEDAKRREYAAPHEHARARARRADRRPLRPHAAGGAGARVDDGAARASTSSSTTRSRRCARPPTPARSPCGPSCARRWRLARQPRAAAARAVQPDPERDPPHAARRQRHRPRRGRRRRRRDRGRRHRRRDRAPSSASASSSRSTAATRRASRPAPGSGWRSRARSSRRTAARSGSRTRRPAPASASGCRPLSDADLDVRGARRLRQREEVADERRRGRSTPHHSGSAGASGPAGEDRRVAARTGQRAGSHHPRADPALFVEAPDTLAARIGGVDAAMKRHVSSVGVAALLLARRRPRRGSSCSTAAARSRTCAARGRTAAGCGRSSPTGRATGATRGGPVAGTAGWRWVYGGAVAHARHRGRPGDELDRSRSARAAVRPVLVRFRPDGARYVVAEAASRSAAPQLCSYNTDLSGTNDGRYCLATRRLERDGLHAGRAHPHVPSRRHGGERARGHLAAAARGRDGHRRRARASCATPAPTSSPRRSRPVIWVATAPTRSGSSPAGAAWPGAAATSRSRSAA